MSTAGRACRLLVVAVIVALVAVPHHRAAVPRAGTAGTDAVQLASRDVAPDPALASGRATTEATSTGGVRPPLPVPLLSGVIALLLVLAGGRRWTRAWTRERDHRSFAAPSSVQLRAPPLAV